jgi:cyclin B
MNLELNSDSNEYECVYSSENCLSQQTEINKKMRRVLIDWLVGVHKRYQMRSETLFLCVNFIDRFASKNFIKRKEF